MQDVQTIRELQQSDIICIKDYWLNSSPEHLQGMGVEAAELGEKFTTFEEYMSQQLDLDYPEKSDYYLIGELNGQAVGHCYVNDITYGQEAAMHLHIWNTTVRKKGMGSTMVRQSIPLFFDKLAIKVLICEPYAHNTAPNKTLERIGFKFIKRHVAKAAGWSFSLEVNRWEMRK